MAKRKRKNHPEQQRGASTHPSDNRCGRFLPTKALDVLPLRLQFLAELCTRGDQDSTQKGGEKARALTHSVHGMRTAFCFGCQCGLQRCPSFCFHVCPPPPQRGHALRGSSARAARAHRPLPVCPASCPIYAGVASGPAPSAALTRLFAPWRPLGLEREAVEKKQRMPNTDTQKQDKNANW